MKTTVAAVLLVACTFLSASTVQSQIVLSPERTGHTATLLNSGKVLIAGGVNETATLDSALLYDPATGLITPPGTMTAPRADHTAPLLHDGKVLLPADDQGARLLHPCRFSAPPTWL